MLPAIFRLTKEKDFKRIMRSRQAVFSAWFRLKYSFNHLSFSRFAVVVSTKVSKRAVKRNKIKRQTREIIRLNLKKFKPGYDVAVSVNPPALGRDYQELEANLLNLFNKARLLK